MKWRITHDDGTQLEWEDPITLSDGTTGKASLVNIDPTTVGQLLTLNDTGQVVHSLVFPLESRSTRKPFWRQTVYMQLDNRIGSSAISGYNEFDPTTGEEHLFVTVIDAEGNLTPNATVDVQLHENEVFSPELRAKIIADKAAFEAVVVKNTPTDTPVEPTLTEAVINQDGSVTT